MLYELQFSIIGQVTSAKSVQCSTDKYDRLGILVGKEKSLDILTDMPVCAWIPLPRYNWSLLSTH